MPPRAARIAPSRRPPPENPPGRPPRKSRPEHRRKTRRIEFRYGLVSPLWLLVFKEDLPWTSPRTPTGNHVIPDCRACRIVSGCQGFTEEQLRCWSKKRMVFFILIQRRHASKGIRKTSAQRADRRRRCRGWGTSRGGEVLAARVGWTAIDACLGAVRIAPAQCSARVVGARHDAHRHTAIRCPQHLSHIDSPNGRVGADLLNRHVLQANEGYTSLNF